MICIIPPGTRRAPAFDRIMLALFLPIVAVQPKAFKGWPAQFGRRSALRWLQLVGCYLQSPLAELLAVMLQRTIAARPDSRLGHACAGLFGGHRCTGRYLFDAQSGHVVPRRAAG